MSFIYFVKDYNTVDNFVNIKAMIDCIIKKKKLFTAAACFEQQANIQQFPRWNLLHIWIRLIGFW